MAATRLALALLLTAAVAASQLPAAAVATNYTVGDEKGWNPDVDYTAWVKKHKPFYKGDWLIFQYQNGRSDVVQVDEVGYDNCDKANALSSYSKGSTYAFQLKEAKDYYFICSYGYCYHGMKVHVTAKSSGSSSSGSGSGSSSGSQEVTPVAVPEEPEEQPEVQEQEVPEADEEVGEDLPECPDHRPRSFERVPAFEEVEVTEQASGEELSSVGSGPDVGVLESKLVVVSEQGAVHEQVFFEPCCMTVVVEESDDE